MFTAIQFSFPEILSFICLSQAVYVLVYLLLRSGNLRQAIVPCAYFTVLSCALILDAASARWSLLDHLSLYQWGFWFALLPLGALLILQIAGLGQSPAMRYYALLLTIPAVLAAYLLPDTNEGMYVAGLVAGALCLLAVWLRRDLLDGLHADPQSGRERFWLVLCMILLNVAFLASVFGYLSGLYDVHKWTLIRAILGLAFIYSVSTSLFRIYPQTVTILKKGQKEDALNADERAIADRLDTLFQREKIYQEAEIGRTELARELGIGEATLSRIINIHYGRTIPQLLNEMRVRDAQKLLRETDVPIQNVFEESGFNSITTFNRVFKELTGDSPKEYRMRNRA